VLVVVLYVVCKLIFVFFENPIVGNNNSDNKRYHDWPTRDIFRLYPWIDTVDPRINAFLLQTI
jgi:hypothetical protein